MTSPAQKKIKWNADGYVDKPAVKYVVKEAGATKPE
mgnify:CR=1 FL=1